MSGSESDKGHRLDSYSNEELSAKEPIQRGLSPAPTTSASHDDVNPPTLSMALNLTVHQKQLLVRSWPKVQTYNRIHGGDSIFARFCEKSATGRETFQKVAVLQSFAVSEPSESAIKKHEQYLLQLLDKAIENLNKDCEPLLRECLAYGAQHATLQELLTETVWDQLAEAIIERVNMISGKRREHWFV